MVLISGLDAQFCGLGAQLYVRSMQRWVTVSKWISLVQLFVMHEYLCLSTTTSERYKVSLFA